MNECIPFVAMDCMREMEGKRIHEHHNLINDKMMKYSPQIVCVPGPIIVGAGPSGLAAAACLKEKGLPSVILERSDCIASLWHLRSYDRLRLHLPKKFCELPLMGFPDEFPTYPSKEQFINYLEGYARKFDINPEFNQAVVMAEYDMSTGLWRVRTTGKKSEMTEYVSPWLIVATGENAEPVIPLIDGMDEFKGVIIHTSWYKSGSIFKGKKVLVVGCGNSGMEVCLDLHNHHAQPTLVVRDTVHVLPREMLGRSTFGLSMYLLKWLPIQLIDQLLLIISRIMLGDTAKHGLNRPLKGPLEVKNLTGKTPVLDAGTLAKIKKGDIKVCPGIRRLASNYTVEFANGKTENFDAIILATGYKSNVPSWLKEKAMFSEKDGLPKKPFPNCWKGESGLYAVGFTKRGLLGASMDAKRIASDIEMSWKSQPKYFSYIWK